jgi:hypothetical protein
MSPLLAAPPLLAGSRIASVGKGEAATEVMFLAGGSVLLLHLG